MMQHSVKSLYFSHDVDSFNDDKIIRLRMKFGVEGYGLYWAILEMMFNADDYELDASEESLHAIAYHTKTNIDAIAYLEHCVSIGLFKLNGERFYSEGFKKRIEIQTEKIRTRKEKAKAAAAARWGDSKSKTSDVDAKEATEQSDSNANALHMQCETMPNKSKTKTKSKTKNKSIVLDSSNTKVLEEESGAGVIAETNEDLEKVSAALVNLVGRLPSRNEGQYLIDWIVSDGIDPDLVIACINEADANSARNIAYVKAVLNNAIEYGCRTVEDFQRKKEVFESQKNKTTVRSKKVVDYSQDVDTYEQLMNEKNGGAKYAG